jgi:hypothetical protein
VVYKTDENALIDEGEPCRYQVHPCVEVAGHEATPQPSAFGGGFVPIDPELIRPHQRYDPSN